MGMAHAKRQHVARTRFKEALPVSVELIGSSNLYELQTINISSGGLFVAFEESYIPFHHNSLLEVKLSLGSGADARQISFLGKFVHHQVGMGFGIRISQMDESIEAIWVEYLHSFGQKHPDKVY